MKGIGSWILGQVWNRVGFIGQSCTRFRCVAEGVKSAPTVIELAREKGISLPISEDVYRVITGESNARGVYRGLLRVMAGAESEPG